MIDEQDFDEEEVSADDVSEDDNETFDTVPCPYCGEQIHEDSVRCPHCENYISSADGPQLKVQPWWIIVGVVLCLATILLWVISGWMI